MTARLLKRVGEAIYGPLWQSEMARSLLVNDRTVRRWVVGESPIPEGVWGDLMEQAVERAERLSQAVADLQERQNH